MSKFALTAAATMASVVLGALPFDPSKYTVLEVCTGKLDSASKCVEDTCYDLLKLDPGAFTGNKVTYTSGTHIYITDDPDYVCENDGGYTYFILEKTVTKAFGCKRRRLYDESFEESETAVVCDDTMEYFKITPSKSNSAALTAMAALLVAATQF